MTRRVAVITPYYRESDAILRQCLDSVAAQTVPCHHIMLADGYPLDWVAKRVGDHIAFGSPHRDFGNFGRGAGALHAFQAGYDFVAMLDADNWLQPQHVETLLACIETTGSHVAVSHRSLHRIDGSLLDAHDTESDGIRFADTSTYLFRRTMIDLMTVWTNMPREAGPVCDMIFWAALRERKIPVAVTGLPTLCYRTPYYVHYASRGETPPPDAKMPDAIDAAIEAWNRLPPAEQLAIVRGTPRF
jgi:glycosyltransferase involved in cell wall biosynthesis